MFVVVLVGEVGGFDDDVSGTYEVDLLLCIEISPPNWIDRKRIIGEKLIKQYC